MATPSLRCPVCQEAIDVKEEPAQAEEDESLQEEDFKEFDPMAKYNEHVSECLKTAPRPDAPADQDRSVLQARVVIISRLGAGLGLMHGLHSNLRSVRRRIIPCSSTLANAGSAEENSDNSVMSLVEPSE